MVPLSYSVIVCVPIHSLAMHEESSTRRRVEDDVHEGAVPAYLLDRETTTRAKACLPFFVFFVLMIVFELPSNC